jgi:multiple antibiotic resistance protein
VLVRLPAIDFVNDKTGKPVGVSSHIGRRPIAAFGNSDGDRQMQVAGGAVVAAVGWNVLTDDSKPSSAAVDVHKASVTAMDRAVYPLTMPPTVDPGVLAVGVAIGANHAHTVENLLVQLAAAVIGAGIVAVSVLFTRRHAESFAQRIGHEGMVIVLRRCALIVLSIGIRIVWNGIEGLLKEIGVPA